MRITVCELPADIARLDEAWDGLVEHCGDAGTDLLVLPEMPFYRWLAVTDEVDPGAWDDAVRAHLDWEGRLDDLDVPTVLGSRPVVLEGRRHNQAFVWENGVSRPAHLKYHLPNEEGFWEATWYEPGPKEFEIAASEAGPIGFMVCTEVWFTEHARAYGRSGAVVIATPRATEWDTRDRWLIGGQAAAIMSGGFAVSSNRSGVDPSGWRWGGLGWIIDPSGTVLATTSEADPWITVDIDPHEALRARGTYPRYVPE